MNEAGSAGIVSDTPILIVPVVVCGTKVTERIGNDLHAIHMPEAIDQACSMSGSKWPQIQRDAVRASSAHGSQPQSAQIEACSGDRRFDCGQLAFPSGHPELQLVGAMVLKEVPLDRAQTSLDG